MKLKGRKQSANVKDVGSSSVKQTRTLRSGKGPRVNSDYDVYGKTMISTALRNNSKQAWINKKKDRIK